MTGDEMVGWRHLLNGHEFEQAPGDCEEQGSLVCCSSWGCKESDMTEQLNNSSVEGFPFLYTLYSIYCLQTVLLLIEFYRKNASEYHSVGDDNLTILIKHNCSYAANNY